MKVTRFQLICHTVDKEGNEIDYKEIFKVLWKLQDETRSIKNKAVQLLWEWYNFSSEYKKKYGEYPSNEDTLGYKGGMRSYLYDRLKTESTMNTANFTSTLDQARNQFQDGLTDYLKGERSIIEYKNNQPLELHNKSIVLERTKDEYTVVLSILSKDGSIKHNIPQRLTFKCEVKDKSTREILNRCINGDYKISGSKLVYVKKKKGGGEKNSSGKWCLNLGYSFDAEAKKLDEDKILGIDLGIVKPFVASVYGDYNRLWVDGGKDSEIEAFRRKVEARRKALLRQRKVCGDGSIGHGYKTRTAPANALEDKIARFRDTINHKYSRAIVEYAVKQNCGVIQMENLKGITDGEQPRYLKNWSYFDLKTKIENKAKEHGIKVVYIEPQYTTLRCSKCGYIDKENNPNQATFICQSCGFKANADYNASQNIAINDIDKIIKADLKIEEKKEKTKKNKK